MTKPEMNRRLATLTETEKRDIHAMILTGFGANGIVQNRRYTLKQVNAMFEWVRRYGRIIPN